MAVGTPCSIARRNASKRTGSEAMSYPSAASCRARSSTAFIRIGLLPLVGSLAPGHDGSSGPAEVQPSRRGDTYIYNVDKFWIVEEVQELREAVTDEEKASELGDLFFAMVNLARWLNIQAEDALRQANRRFQWRYNKMEELAQQRGLDFAQLPLDDKEALWQEAKRLEG